MRFNQRITSTIRFIPTPPAQLPDAAPLPSYLHNYVWGGRCYFPAPNGNYINNKIKINVVNLNLIGHISNEEHDDAGMRHLRPLHYDNCSKNTGNAYRETIQTIGNVICENIHGNHGIIDL